MKYKFDDIAINCIAKKKPTEADKDHYLGLEHLDSGTFYVSRWGAESAPSGDKLIMREGDLLFGKRRAYQKKVAIAPFDGIFSAHGMVLRPKEAVIYPRFFPHFIASDYFLKEAIRISVGGLSPTINWKDLKALEFNLPPIDKQRRLADLLWAANDLKEAYKRAIAASDEMLKAKFRRMFGEGIPRRPLSELVTMMDDKRRPINDSERSTMKDGELFPYYGATGVVDYINAYLTDETLLCIAEDCGNYGPGEDSSYIISGKAWVNNHAHLVKPRESICRMLYLHHWLRIADLRPYISGTTRKKLTQGKLLTINVPTPSLDLQQKFEATAEQNSLSVSKLRNLISSINDVIKGIINQALEA